MCSLLSNEALSDVHEITYSQKSWVSLYYYIKELLYLNSMYGSIIIWLMISSILIICYFHGSLFYQLLFSSITTTTLLASNYISGRFIIPYMRYSSLPVFGELWRQPGTPHCPNGSPGTFSSFHGRMGTTCPVKTKFRIALSDSDLHGNLQYLRHILQ